MANIITVHMATNEPAASSQLWPGILIHIMDIAQPPGMGIAPDMDLDQSSVPVAVAPNRTTPAA
jgi:hypothetical protein